MRFSPLCAFLLDAELVVCGGAAPAPDGSTMAAAAVSARGGRDVFRTPRHRVSDPRTRATRARAAAEPAATASAAPTDGAALDTVVVTREAGKNGALSSALQARGVRCIEMPLVETVEGEDRAELAPTLARGELGGIVLAPKFRMWRK